jgi:soluble lytic murein transglycosylase-like protein
VRFCLLAAVPVILLGAALLTTDDAVAAGSGGVATSSAGAEGEQPSSGSRASKYARLWERTSRGDRRWAHKTAQCESGGDPDALGSGGLYRGAFQFMKSTWKSAPRSPGGDPIDYSYRTQAVVAIALMHADGAGHWPNCG